MRDKIKDISPDNFANKVLAKLAPNPCEFFAYTLATF